MATKPRSTLGIRCRPTACRRVTPARRADRSAAEWALIAPRQPSPLPSAAAQQGAGGRAPSTQPQSPRWSTSSPCRTSGRAGRAAACPRRRCAALPARRLAMARSALPPSLRQCALVGDAPAPATPTAGPSDAPRPRSRSRLTGGGKLRPMRPGVHRAEDPVVMLHPHHVGIGGAAGDPMRILDLEAAGLLRRHIGGDQPSPRSFQVAPSSPKSQHPAAGDGDEDPLRIARVGRYRMDAGVVIAAAEPARRAPGHPRARGLSCQLAPPSSERNRPAGIGADPQPPGMMRAAGFERPDLEARRRGRRRASLRRATERRGAGSSCQASPPSFERCSLGVRNGRA